MAGGEAAKVEKGGRSNQKERRRVKRKEQNEDEVGGEKVIWKKDTSKKNVG